MINQCGSFLLFLEITNTIFPLFSPIFLHTQLACKLSKYYLDFVAKSTVWWLNHRKVNIIEAF